MMYLEVIGELRNSSLEDTENSYREILYFSSRKELDATLLRERDDVQQFNWKSFPRYSKISGVLVIEIPEPLFLKFWFKGFGFAALIKIARSLRARKTIIVSYAIENLDPLSRCTIPQLDAFPFLNRFISRNITHVVRATSSLISSVGFGTKAAEANYLNNGFFSRGCHMFLAQSKLELCDCVKVHSGVRNGIVYLGERSSRKSTDEIYKAFRELSDRYNEYFFMMCGPGIGTYETTENSNFSLSEKISRQEIHEILRNSKVVVLPSKRIKRWREQIGLPILEGLSHKTHVLATNESGLWLEQPSNSNITWINSTNFETLIKEIDFLICKDVQFNIRDSNVQIPSHLEFRRKIIKNLSS